MGYERGAFTGATQSKPGQLEQAAGGVPFLDEVGEMSLAAQAKFLRVLEEREFQRLGGTRILKTNARIIAATNRDLLKAIERGQFREDLYYRLNVFAIHLPPLRDRRDDRRLKATGHDVLPVNPHMQTFEGDRCYPNVDSIPGGVEGVVIVTRPEATERIVRECADAGVRRVWMHQSMGKGTSVSSEAVEYCRQHDISDRRCLPDDVRPWRPLRTRACGGSSKRRGDGARRSHHHANLC